MTHHATAMAFRAKSCLCPSSRALTFAAIADAAQTCLLEDFVKAAMYGGAIVGMLVMGSIGSTAGRDTVAAACAPFCLIFWSSRFTGGLVCASLCCCNWASQGPASDYIGRRMGLIGCSLITLAGVLSQACLLGATLSCAALVMVGELISMKCPHGPWSNMNMPCHGVSHKSWDIKGIAACRFAWPHTSTVRVRLKHG